MRPVRVLSVLLIVAASQFAIACGSDDSGDSGGTSSADTWRIGLEGPLTGEQSGVGQGMLKGVPDLFLPVPRGNYAGLYIEMKHGDNKPTPEQARFLQESVDCGYQAAVCWSAAEAIAVIKAYYGVSE